jgi:adenine-specific DNA-methyltransferase
MFSLSVSRPRRNAAAFDQQQVPAPLVGFENHLNVYHRDSAGLPMELARGLALFLNSTLVDSYFRQFNGHTQVNATDLRMLQYPDQEVLETLGAHVGDRLPSQAEIDELLEREIPYPLRWETLLRSV